MKVLDLQCADGHVFEGWFASEDDFQGQLGRGLVECPMCGDTHIVKRLSAPRLNFGASPVGAAAVPGSPGTPGTHGKGPSQELAAVPPPEMQAALQAAWMKAVAHVMAHTEDVGARFAEEARRIHYGEADERGIRGQASREETEALLDEGISVVPLPVPRDLKGPLQ